ncbi:MAG TPA: ANTAR domain-containing protein [Acidimicrobiia bacterium]|nr:ANTAR domain-containing protein [Acidimicrobiia bacterium]
MGTAWGADYHWVGNDSPPVYSATVHQASGMVALQADCTFADAIQLMQDRAIVQGLALEQVATAVLDRSISFGD